VSAEAEESYQRFKWEVAADAAFEHEQGLWEPLWLANTLYPELHQNEREKLAERALRELFAEGLIVFHRKGGTWPAFDGTQQVLDGQAVEAAIAGSSWRSVPPEDTTIWFEGTEAGNTSVRERWRELGSGEKD
jgi:hypothetical protein